MRRSEFYFDGAAGRRLFGRTWRSSTIERSVLITHGFAEHCGRYEHVARWLAERGSEVFAYDHQGHGRSSGRRGHVASFGHYLDDLEVAIRRVRDLDPGRPLVLLGHSMGGLVVCNLVVHRIPDIDLAIASAPALTPAATESRALLLAMRMARVFAPRLRFDAGIEAAGLSRDPKVGERYEADPLVDTRASLSLAVEMPRAGRAALASAERLAVPLLLLHGEDDRMCRPEASASFQARAAAEAAHTCELRSYPGLRHEILNEPEGPQVLGDIFQWIEANEGRST